MARCLLLSSVFCIMAVISISSAEQQREYVVHSVFGQQRLADRDYIVMNNGDRVTGCVVTKAFTIATCAAVMELSMSQCAGVRFAAGGDNPAVVLCKNFSRLVGRPDLKTLAIVVEGDAKERLIDCSEIRYAILKLSKAEVADNRKLSSVSALCTSSGDVLACRLPNQVLKVDCGYALVDVNSRDLDKMSRKADDRGKFVLSCFNGASYTGNLVSDSISLHVDLLKKVVKVSSMSIEELACKRTLGYIEEQLKGDAMAPPNLPRYMSEVEGCKYANIEQLADGSAEALVAQKEWTSRGYPLEVMISGIDIGFRLIPSGCARMGASGDDQASSWEFPEHSLSIGYAFYMSTTEVTQGQWAKVMGTNPAKYKGMEGSLLRPVEGVSWRECQVFVSKLRATAKCGAALRLPSEAEWEYACRAGTVKPRYGELEAVAWFDENSSSATLPVAGKLPNAWGLYDMLGNVWEWCEDQWHLNYEGAPVDGSVWLGGSEKRVLRGGSYSSKSQACRSASRSSDDPDKRFNNVGIRLVLDVR